MNRRAAAAVRCILSLWLAVIFQAGMVPCLAKAARTNGTGGGPWTAAQTWADGKLPGADEIVQVVAGDTLVIGVPTKQCCGGLLIEEGARVQSEVLGATLICHDDVQVHGTLALGPGSELLVDCPENMRHGIWVGSAGSLFCTGSHGFDRNCALGAARRDGRHNTFVRIERDGKATFRFCDLSYLGGKVPKTASQRVAAVPTASAGPARRGGFIVPKAPRLDGGYGIFFWGDVTVEGCHIHHCEQGVHLITGGRITLRHNLFADNRQGLTIYRPDGVTVTGNRFLRNGTGLSAAAKYTEASCVVSDNLFEKNKIGMEVRGPLARASFHDNNYVDNEVGLRIASSNAVVADECFAGNRYAVELAPATVGARLLGSALGSLQGEARPSLQADVLVATPGPSNLVLDRCRFGRDQPIEFAAEVPGQPGGQRWVSSRDHNGIAGQTKRYEARAVQR